MVRRSRKRAADSIPSYEAEHDALIEAFRREGRLQAVLKAALAKAVGPDGRSKLELQAVKGEIFISSSFRAPLDRFGGLLKALGRLL